jgi:hypothetical protein
MCSTHQIIRSGHCILLLFLGLPLFSFCQHVSEKEGQHANEKYAKTDRNFKMSQNVRIMFYNVENLYDPYDDTTKLDDEFTSSGIKHWSYGKFQAKLFHLAKVILAAGNPDPPVIVGMCEIENRYVLNKLVWQTPLVKFRYRIIHYDSPDARGVDVALIYRTEKFHPLSSSKIRIRFPFDTTILTRDILYVKGIIFSGDTIHVFINHWPSRRGGAAESAPRRNYVAGQLHLKVDSIFTKDTAANIIILGDFNDEPGNESIAGILTGNAPEQRPQRPVLVDLMDGVYRKGKTGTIKYQGKWSVFDQVIVSDALVHSMNGLHASEDDAHIFTAGFLLKDDSRFLGSQPGRTYTGPRYTGGFSDHLPVYLDIWQY